jgi:hypothetical protein
MDGRKARGRIVQIISRAAIPRLSSRSTTPLPWPQTDLPLIRLEQSQRSALGRSLESAFSHVRRGAWLYSCRTPTQIDANLAECMNKKQ